MPERNIGVVVVVWMEWEWKSLVELPVDSDKEILDMSRSEQVTKEYMADMHEGGSSKNLLVLTENYSC